MAVPRKNSVRQNVLSQIKEKESEVEILKGKVKQLPERVDISWLEDYTCFQRICDESKYLFDLVTASVWNAPQTNGRVASTALRKQE